MTLIAPSLMAADLLKIGQEIIAVESAGADWLHLDIMDGHFVPNVTFGPETVSQVKSITKLPIDVHLMVNPAEPFIEMYAKAGADHISIHPESTPHIHRSLMLIKEFGLKAGVAINPGTTINVIEPVIELLDIVLIMSVNPGFYGQKFIHSVLPKVRALKELRIKYQQHFQIVVDGGVNFENASEIVNAGADVLVAGNSVFKQLNYADAIQQLKA